MVVETDGRVVVVPGGTVVDGRVVTAWNSHII